MTDQTTITLPGGTIVKVVQLSDRELRQLRREYSFSRWLQRVLAAEPGTQFLVARENYEKAQVARRELQSKLEAMGIEARNLYHDRLETPNGAHIYFRGYCGLEEWLKSRGIHEPDPDSDVTTTILVERALGGL